MANDLNPSVSVSDQPAVDASLVSYTHVIYALHSLSVLIGFTSALTIVGSFLFGFPSIIAVIMNYVRRSEAHGTYLESHFRWQIRTFWFALLWVVLVTVISAPFMLIGIGFVMWLLGCGCVGIWVIYRILRGWLALRDQRPVNP